MMFSKEREAIITLLLLLFANGTISMLFVVENQCNYSVWIDSLPSMDLIIFEVPPNETLITNADDSWRGILWLRTHCTTDTTGRFSCLTGNCDSSTESCNNNSPHPPFTSIEVLNNSTHLDYGINLQHGFNVPIMVHPEQADPSCKDASCVEDINRLCPLHLQVKGPNGKVIGCKSDCDVSGDPKACCNGVYGSKEKCEPTASASFFKQACPLAHTWKYDSWVTSCGGASFDIILCP